MTTSQKVDRATLGQQMFTNLASLRPRALDASAVEVVKARVPDPTIFDDVPPFLFDAIISNNTRDFYHTRMSEESLKNYVEDAERGVSFLDSHGWQRLGLGRTFASQLTSTPGGLEEFPGENRIEVAASVYILPNYNPGGGSILTNDFIRGVRGGTIFDVSIGFYAEFMRCSICGLDMWDWDCWHIPGFTYEIKGEDGKVLETKRAFAWVEGGHLCEVSAVYDGATEGAGITTIVPFVKAEVEAEAGRLKANARLLIESRYRRNLPTPQRFIAGANATGEDMSKLTTKGKRSAEEEAALAELDTVADVETPDPAPEEETDDTLIETVEDSDDEDDNDGDDEGEREVDVVAERAKALYGEVRGMLGGDVGKRLGLPKGQSVKERVADLLKLAEAGKRYRDDLETEALAAGVRAHGKKFNEKNWRGICAKADIDGLKDIIATFETEAGTRFKGGRQTLEEGTGGGQGTGATTGALPVSAYKG